MGALTAVEVDPPPGVALAMRAANGSVAVSPHAPAATARLTDGPVGYSSVNDGGHRYRALVVDRAGIRVVALLDLAPWETVRRQLLLALAVAEFVGMLAIAVIVAMLSRRAIRPLSTALALQRRFVADASHELRAPLTLLPTRAQMLARNADKQNVDNNLSTQLNESMTKGPVARRQAVRCCADGCDRNGARGVCERTRVNPGDCRVHHRPIGR